MKKKSMPTTGTIIRTTDMRNVASVHVNAKTANGKSRNGMKKITGLVIQEF